MRARILFLAASMSAASALVFAQPTCTAPGENLMSWPTVDPVWQFCWVRPSLSSGPNGSGIEIRDAYYNGHLVLKRGHVPIVNVHYEQVGGSCGGANLCYRDYMHAERSYLSDNVCPPPYSGTTCGYAEPACPPITVCEQHQGVDVCPNPPPDCPVTCFSGVSAEKLPDRLILTTQTSAGWYRYEMKWTFHHDGTIEPFFGFSAVADNCVNFTHDHNAYWRLDFDIDGPADDKITETNKPNGQGGTQIKTETMRLDNQANLSWIVKDKTGKRGYRIIPGAEKDFPADSFAVGDVWFLKYKPEELDDTGQSGPACAIKIGNFINGESLADDVVVWYRTGVRHLGGDLDDCHSVGPTIVPVGDWSP